MQFNSFAKTGLIGVDRPYGRGIEEYLRDTNSLLRIRVLKCNTVATVERRDGQTIRPL